ncbi:hypothetical protein D3C80_1408050 [compost metagenome]
MAGQPGAERRRDVPRKTHGGRQAQLAAGRIALGRQLGACLCRRRAHGGALGIETAAGVGQRQLPGGAVQQRHAARALELAQLLAHGRRAHAQRARGAAHGAVLHHLGEDRHAFEIVHGRP